MSEIQGREVLQGTPYRTQVYQATHDGAGNRLPLMERSFISFTYGGKSIEDYEFVSVVESDRLNRQIYGNFADDTSTYNTVDGQFYWGTNFEAGSISFNLATDGMAEEKLHDFKNWFQPGITRELILAENPNRAIKARIATPPQYSVIPFESKTTVKIAGREYQTSTTMYKGSITLEFVMDDPFWYSVRNIIPFTVSDANGNMVQALDDADTLKVILEDKVPYLRMLETDTILGDGIYTSTGTKREKMNLGTEDTGHLYYAGTAPGQTIIECKIIPKFVGGSNWSEQIALEYAVVGTAEVGSAVIRKDYSGDAAANQLYIMEPRNYIYKRKVDETSKEYNYLAVGDKVFKFTTPSVYTGYNQALEIFDSFEVGASIIDIRTAIRDGVKEYYSRAWAMAAVKYLSCTDFVDDSKNVKNVTSGSNEISFHYALNKLMWYFLVDQEDSQPKSATLTFNSKTGEAIGTFRVRQIRPNVNFDEYIEPRSGGDYFSYFGGSGDTKTVTENVGDMVYDKYLVLEGQNKPNENGTISIEDCSDVSTDYENGLQDLSISYKYTYL